MKKTLLLVFALFTVITCLSFTALSAQAATSGYLTYNIENGEAVIKGCDQSATGEIIIPSTLEGYPVTKIAFPGFIGCSYITSITLPETITYIEESTFESCDALAKVNISSIKSWCNIQFENTWGNPLYLAKKLYVNGKLLTEIVIPDGITSIGDYAFAGCEMTSITLPKSIQSIGSYAFLECKNLQNLTIPENVTSIGSYALYQCSTLKEINVPSKVKTIGERAFDYCSNLKNINVDKNNVTFCSVDGVLFNKNQTSLIRYPQGKTQTKYIIPSGVSTIEYAAFLECDYLTEISIPDSVTTIVSRAFCDCSLLKNIALPSKIKTIASQTFSGCEAIESIVIPYGVKTIEYMAFAACKTLKTIVIPKTVEPLTRYTYAFSECTNLKNVYYTGTQNEWSTFINKASPYSGLESATITYNYTLQNGWAEENGNWYFYENGIKIRNGWRKDNTGWCFLDGDGIWVNNCIVKDSIGFAYISANGYFNDKESGWKNVNNNWYFIENGYAVTNNWRKDNTGWCFLDEYGVWVLNTFVKDSTNKWAYITPDGYYYETTGWVELGSDWYYLENGYRVENDWRKDSTGWCFLDKDGKWVLNTFVKDSTNMLAYITKDGYYYETNGKVTYNGKSYTLKGGYLVLNGWMAVGNDWFYLENSKCVINDWRKDSTGWCFLSETGAMVTNDWVKDSTGWCYLDNSGYWDGVYYTSPAK